MTPYRLYVVAAWYQHFLYFCGQRRLPARHPRLVFLSQHNYTRLLLGVHRPRFYLYSLPEHFKRLSDQLIVCQGEHVDDDELAEWIEAFHAELGVARG